MAIEKVEKLDKVKKASRSIESFQKILEKHNPKQVAPNKEQIESFMREDQKVNNKAQDDAKIANRGDDANKRPSLMQEVANVNRKVAALSKHSTEDFLAQARNAADQIETIKSRLDDPKIKIKGSVQHLLKNRLSDINDNLKIAFSKAGLEYKAPEVGGPGKNPVVRFLGQLTHGQAQLESLSSHVQSLSGDNDLSAGQMLALQIKMHHVSQQLEFFTNLLNKTLESTKTLMNVQV